MADQKRRIRGGSERADWANKDTAGRKGGKDGEIRDAEGEE